MKSVSLEVGNDTVLVAIEPDLIESVEQDPKDHDLCIVRMTSGTAHNINRSYTYVTGIIRKFYESN
jgi:hypothetical protein